MPDYTVALIIFAIGVFTTLCTVSYILIGNRKYKDVDPFAEE